MKKRKTACVFLGLSLLLVSFGGCGAQGGTPEDVQAPQRGRYVEREVEMPEEWSDLAVKQIFTVEDRVHLLTAEQQEGKTLLKEWEENDGTFTDVTKGWLDAVDLVCEDWADVKLLQGNERQYLFARLINEQGSYQGYLWREEDGAAVDITPEKWSVPDEAWGTYEYIQGITALDNGALAAVSYRYIDLINGEDGSIQDSQEIAADYGETVFGDGENLYLTTLDRSGSGNVSGLEKRAGGRRDAPVEIELPVKSMGGILICALKDGTLVTAGTEGIFRYNAVSEEWEKLLEGAETDFALTTRWCTGLTALSDGRVYALFREDGGGTSLMEYVYDPDAVTEITKRLTLYTVWDNPMLQQAAVLYHKGHPDTLITVECAYTNEDKYSDKAPDYNQVYQNLNTRLMGEEAPDILVMDHLNAQNYVQKGLLADIGQVVGPLEESGGLLENITGAYVQEDGSRYLVPLMFGFPMAIGRDITKQDMDSLDSLAEFLAGKQESYMGPMTAGELTDRFYPYFCDQLVKDNALDREALGEILKELKAVADNSGTVEERGQDERPYNIWDLTSQAKCVIEPADGFWDCMTLMAIRDYIQGEFTCYENCFEPHLVTGINARSAYLDTAMDFLGFALSKEAQDTEFYSGFPVNREALESLAASDRSDLAMETAIETDDGGMEEFVIGDFSQETARELVEICERLERPAVEDSKIREELAAALPGYLDGSRSLEETLDAVEGGLKMYLAE